MRQIGPRVKRAFIRLEDKTFIVNVYQKENVYTFDLIDIANRRESKKENAKVVKIRGVYEYDSNKLLNTKDKTIPEYLLDNIYFSNER